MEATMFAGWIAWFANNETPIKYESPPKKIAGLRAYGAASLRTLRPDRWLVQRNYRESPVAGFALSCFVGSSLVGCFLGS
jgi:hypothetical protein